MYLLADYINQLCFQHADYIKNFLPQQTNANQDVSGSSKLSIGSGLIKHLKKNNSGGPNVGELMQGWNTSLCTCLSTGQGIYSDPFRK